MIPATTPIPPVPRIPPIIKDDEREEDDTYEDNYEPIIDWDDSEDQENEQEPTIN